MKGHTHAVRHDPKWSTSYEKQYFYITAFTRFREIITKMSVSQFQWRKQWFAISPVTLFLTQKTNIFEDIEHSWNGLSNDYMICWSYKIYNVFYVLISRWWRQIASEPFALKHQKEKLLSDTTKVSQKTKTKQKNTTHYFPG